MNEQKIIKRKTFADLLQSRSITAYKLGRMLGYKGGNTVYKWIYGKSEPNAATMLKLIKILEISAEEMLQMFAEGD